VCRFETGTASNRRSYAHSLHVTPTVENQDTFVLSFHYDTCGQEHEKLAYMDIELVENIQLETTSERSKDSPLEEKKYSVLHAMWAIYPEIETGLKDSPGIESARKFLYTIFSNREWELRNSRSDLHPLQKVLALDCIRTLECIISAENERKSGYSTLGILWQLAHGVPASINAVPHGFIEEMIHLLRGAWGCAFIYPRDPDGTIHSPAYLDQYGRKAAQTRTELMDKIAGRMARYVDRYPFGLDENVIEKRKANRDRILRHLGATENDWYDHRWHMKNVIRDLKMLSALSELRAETAEAVRLANTYRVPFGITPYYLSLMDSDIRDTRDHAICAQVLPPLDYMQSMIERREDRSFAFDFMHEHDSSPIDLVTRRYPGIAIIKPFNACSQICVYCQRNWEIEDVLAPTAMADKQTLGNAIKWIRNHTSIGEILITGGDPCLMTDTSIERLLNEFVSMSHIYRIRIGTRTPVIIPMRWTNELVSTLATFHEPGRREIAVVTHVEHSYEITPDLMNAVRIISNTGIGVYNQEVFTTDNSRRFESAKLRKELRLVGIDPFYTFNMKGKSEMKRYRVPITRVLQERKEEARLFPGLDRTDEHVFNVPRLGKNHLRAGQDRRLIMIRPDGTRIYEIDPWEKNISAVNPYVYTDVPIHEYLNVLERKGEDINDYRSIWYYH